MKTHGENAYSRPVHLTDVQNLHGRVAIADDTAEWKHQKAWERFDKECESSPGHTVGGLKYHQRDYEKKDLVA